MELCYPSLVILQDKISDFFIERNHINSTAFPNHASDLMWPSTEVIDIILFGDALHALSGSKTWPRSAKYRIWLLCHDMKKIIHEIYNIPLECLGVIPRYSIFPTSRTPNSLNLFHEKDVYFVMSSNYALGKNIELTLGIIQQLQIHYTNKNIHLTICGPKPDTYLVEDEINKFQWVIPPVVKGDLGMDWHKEVSPKSMMINFSTNLFEDFGISLCQAQEAGFPLIISNWGTHHDIQGNNIIKVPTKTHGLHISDSINMKNRIKDTTQYLISRLDTKQTDKTQFPTDSFNIPNEIHINKLIELSTVFINNHLAKTMELHKASLYNPNNPIAKVINRFFE